MYSKIEFGQVSVWDSRDFMESTENEYFSVEVLDDSTINLTIHSKIESISAQWPNCKKIKTLRFDDNISIKAHAFDSAWVENVYAKGNIDFDCYSFEGSVVENCVICKNSSFGVGSFRHTKLLNNVVVGGDVLFSELASFQNSTIQQFDCKGKVAVVSERAFSGCFNLKNFNVENGIEKINSYAFFICSKLKDLPIGKNTKEVGYSAFRGCEAVTKIFIPKSLKLTKGFEFINYGKKDRSELEITLEDGSQCLHSDCFADTYISKLTIPESVDITEFLDLGCLYDDNSKLFYGGKEMPFALVNASKEVREKADAFVLYAKENNKFIPKNMAPYLYSPKGYVEKFYENAKYWQVINNAFSVNVSSAEEYKKYVDVFYKASVVLGVFEGDALSYDATKFILSKLVNNPEFVRLSFEKSKVAENGYNPEFAKFFIMNYREQFADDPAFLTRKVGNNTVNFCSEIYNKWKDVKKAYPHKKVMKRNAYGSIHNAWSEELLLNIVQKAHYPGADENIEFASAASFYGLSTGEYMTLLSWWKKALLIDQNEVLLKINPDTKTKGVTYEYLKKNDLRAPFSGYRNNSCMTPLGIGKECLKHGMTSLNSGFVDFYYNGIQVANAWVWYDPLQKIVALDNVEIPKSMLTKECSANFLQFEAELIKCLSRLYVGIKSAMNEAGLPVIDVCLGDGNLDIDMLDCFKREYQKYGYSRGYSYLVGYGGYTDFSPDDNYILEELSEEEVNKILKECICSFLENYEEFDIEEILQEEIENKDISYSDEEESV